VHLQVFDMALYIRKEPFFICLGDFHFGFNVFKDGKDDLE